MDGGISLEESLGIVGPLLSKGTGADARSEPVEATDKSYPPLLRWAVRGDLTRQVKELLDAEGINIPFPQRDVHTHIETAVPT